MAKDRIGPDSHREGLGNIRNRFGNGEGAAVGIGHHGRVGTRSQSGAVDVGITVVPKNAQWSRAARQRAVEGSVAAVARARYCVGGRDRWRIDERGGGGLGCGARSNRYGVGASREVIIRLGNDVITPLKGIIHAVATGRIHVQDAVIAARTAGGQAAETECQRGIVSADGEVGRIHAVAAVVYHAEVIARCQARHRGAGGTGAPAVAVVLRGETAARRARARRAVGPVGGRRGGHGKHQRIGLGDGKVVDPRSRTRGDGHAVGTRHEIGDVIIRTAIAPLVGVVGAVAARWIHGDGPVALAVAGHVAQAPVGVDGRIGQADARRGGTAVAVGDGHGIAAGGYVLQLRRNIAGTPQVGVGQCAAGRGTRHAAVIAGGGVHFGEVGQ